MKTSLTVRGGMDDYTPEVEIGADDLSDCKTFEEAEEYIRRLLRYDIRHNAASYGYFDGSEYREEIEKMLEQNRLEDEEESK